jgi:hypothetical protein
MRERGLGLGLYFGHAVVREPHPCGLTWAVSARTARRAAAELAHWAPKNAVASRLAHFHQNDALMKKSAILVCSRRIEGHVRPTGMGLVRHDT